LTRKIIRNPAEIIIHACALKSYWADSYNGIPGAADGRVRFCLPAHKVLAQQARSNLQILQASPEEQEDEDEE